MKKKLKEVAFEKFPVILDKFNEPVKNNGGYFVGGKVKEECVRCRVVTIDYFEFTTVVYMFQKQFDTDIYFLRRCTTLVRKFTNIIFLTEIKNFYRFVEKCLQEKINK